MVKRIPGEIITSCEHCPNRHRGRGVLAAGTFTCSKQPKATYRGFEVRKYKDGIPNWCPLDDMPAGVSSRASEPGDDEELYTELKLRILSLEADKLTGIKAILGQEKEHTRLKLVINTQNRQICDLSDTNVRLRESIADLIESKKKTNFPNVGDKPRKLDL